MRVKATAVGFYGSLREVGEEFDIKGKDDLGAWMVEVEKPERAKPGHKPAAKPEESGNLPDA